MAMFQRLLVAYDGSSHSKKALEKAAEFMAEDSNVRTHIVNVTYPPHISLYSLYGPNLSQEVLRDLDKEAQKIISEAEEAMADYKDACYFKRLQGNAPQEIIDYANEHEIDLIIIGSRGLGAFKQMFLGSVSHNVVQQASCPVLIIK